MKKQIKNFKKFNESKGIITYTDECLGYHHGQTDMETGIYEDDNIIGYVQYSLFENMLLVNYIMVLPNRRREGFGSLLMSYIKKQNPNYLYKKTNTTDLGSKFIHKDI